MLSSKLEVLVDFGTKPDQQLLEKTLSELKLRDGVQEAVFKDGAIMVDTSLPSAVVLEVVTKASGKRAVLQGFGETQSAVAMVSSQSCCKKNVLGVIRFQQTSEGPLVADGSIDGLSPSSSHGLHVHDVGDLSQGCESIGGHYNPYDSPHGGPDDPKDRRHAGDLGNIVADENGRATFRILDNVLKVWDIVGRSVAVSENKDDLGRGNSPLSRIDGDSGTSIACGIIARSAGIFQNPKRICACDGVVVWDERDRPIAGKGRRKDTGDAGERDGCCGKETQKKPCCKVWDIVGRSVAVSENKDDLGRGNSPLSRIDGDSGTSIACGIIARSAGIFQNPKRICACDGVVVWDERDRPIAGKGRRKDTGDAGERDGCCGKETQKKPCCKV